MGAMGAAAIALVGAVAALKRYVYNVKVLSSLQILSSELEVWSAPLEVWYLLATT